MLESLFNKFADIKPEILLDERLHHGYFSMKKFYLKNTFLTAEAVVRRCSKKKVFLGILQNLQENNCAKESFLIKLQAPTPATLLKKTLWHRCFPVNFAKLLRISFFTEHLWWLLLQQDISGRLLLILKKLNIQTFNSNNSILINIVGTLYLMIRNLDFVFMIDHVFKILQSSYYKNNF